MSVAGLRTNSIPSSKCFESQPTRAHDQSDNNRDESKFRKGAGPLLERVPTDCRLSSCNARQVVVHRFGRRITPLRVAFAGPENNVVQLPQRGVGALLEF